jgi:hypothetical protein
MTGTTILSTALATCSAKSTNFKQPHYHMDPSRRHNIKWTKQRLGIHPRHIIKTVETCLPQPPLLPQLHQTQTTPRLENRNGIKACETYRHRRHHPLPPQLYTTHATPRLDNRNDIKAWVDPTPQGEKRNRQSIIMTVPLVTEHIEFTSQARMSEYWCAAVRTQTRALSNWPVFKPIRAILKREVIHNSRNYSCLRVTVRKTHAKPKRYWPFHTK